MRPHKWRPKEVYLFPPMGKNNTEPQPPGQEEDWEKELEDGSQHTGKKKQPTCDCVDDLSAEVRERVQNDPSSRQDPYSPAVHHIKPVKWVRFLYTTVDDQFADAEEEGC